VGLKLPSGQLLLLFDTNFYRDCANGRIARSTQDALRAQVLASGGEMFTCVITACELLSNIREEKRELFGHLRQALKTMLRLSTRWLDGPDRFVRMTLSGEPGEAGVDGADLCDNLVSKVSRAANYDQLVEMGFNLDPVREYREGFESTFVSKMEGIARKHIPDYDERRAKKKQAVLRNRKELNEARAQAAAGDVNRAVAVGLAQLAGMERPKGKALEDIADRFRAYGDALASMVLDMLVGYSPRKHSNDCNDLSLLLYFGMPGLRLVTRDERFMGHLAHSQDRHRLIHPAEAGLLTDSVR
jgi:hypothetical protein